MRIDCLTIDASKATETPEGFVRVPAVLARTGIQEYLAAELGLPGDPKRRVPVFRPEDEVFNEESLRSFDNLPLTNQHPGEDVNAKNWKDYTVGWGGKVERAGDTMVTDITITDDALLDPKASNFLAAIAPGDPVGVGQAFEERDHEPSSALSTTSPPSSTAFCQSSSTRPPSSSLTPW